MIVASDVLECRTFAEPGDVFVSGAAFPMVEGRNYFASVVATERS